MKKNAKKSYVFLYTLVFLIVSLAVFFSFLKYRTSFVCTVDGESQYIVYLRYMGQYLRETLSGFLHGHLVPKQFDFSIGVGDDIGAIVRFHPLDLLSVFVPAAFTEQLYAVILLLRFYLAGLAFSAYAFSVHTFRGLGANETGGCFISLPAGERAGDRVLSERPAAPLNVLTGSLVYVFCGYMLIRVTNHPTYAAPFIVLPLLLLGMERAADRKGDLLFPIAVLLGFWSNYYFMYICSIGLLVYALLRYPEMVKEKRMLRFFPYAGKLIALYLTGLLMSMATLLPAMLRYRESFRTSQTSAMQNLWVYADKRRYLAWFLNLISPYQSSGNGLDLNFAVIVLPALALLFTRSFRRYRTLRRSLVLELIALLVPFFGYVFAGMNNENNRWMFLIAFSLGMACVRTIDSFADLDRREFAAVFLTGGFFILAVLAERVLTGGNRYNEVGAAELLIFLALLLVIRKMKPSLHTVRIAVLAAAMLSCAIGGYFTYEPAGGNRISAFRKMGDTTGGYEKLGRKVAAQIPGDDFFRVDAAGVEHGKENSAEYFGYNSIGMYNSILNRNLILNLLDENNIGLDAVTQVHDLDGRPVAENLAHVRYYVAAADNIGKIPYGYSPVPVLLQDGWAVYENQNLLSAGFSSDAFITWDNYQKLTGIEKEMVKLDAVVLPREGKNEQALTAEKLAALGMREVTGPSAAITEVLLPLPDAGNGIVKTETGYQADGKKSVLGFSFTRQGGAYTFLRLTGLEGAEDLEKFSIDSEGIHTGATMRSGNEVYTLGRTDYLINLGYSDTERPSSAFVTFEKAGLHRLTGASIVTVSMEGYEDKIAALNEHSLEDEKIEDGLLQGTIQTDRPGLAVFTIPVQAGWELTVDGEKRDILTLDGMYAGVLLDAGSHQIRLSYRTPGLALGAVMTLLGILAFCALCARSMKRNRRKPPARAIDAHQTALHAARPGRVPPRRN